MNLDMYKLPFNEYSNIPLKKLKAERIHQEDLLFELSKSQDQDGKQVAIELVQKNIEIIDSKIKIVKKDVGSIVGDKVFKSVMWLLLCALCISLIILPIWMILTSFKSNADYTYHPFSWPEAFELSNYAQLFDTLKIRISAKITYSLWDMLGFSIIYATGTSLIGVILTTMMAYVLAKYDFKGRNFIYGLGIVVMIVPIVGSGPSTMIIKKMFGVYDNLPLTILTSCNCAFSGLNFLLLYGTFKTIPWDYAEAVFVDGGGHYSVFFKMYLPMALPTMAVIFILSFLSNWNDYGTFLIWLKSTPNLAYGLYLFSSGQANLYNLQTPQIMAGFTIVIVPSVILYLCSQKLILSKFTVGGLKG